MEMQSEYLALWFDLGYDESLLEKRQELKTWFLKHANVDDFRLTIAYEFAYHLHQKINVGWDSHLCYEDDGRGSGWNLQNWTTVEDLQALLEKTDLSEFNEDLMAVLKEHLTFRIIFHIEQFQNVRYNEFVKTYIHKKEVKYI